MGFFGKIGRAFRHVGSIFKKGTNEVGSVFRKGGHSIARGLGSMAGAGLGAEIAGGIATAVAPELVVPAMAVGGLIGKTAGAEGAGRIEATTRGLVSGKGKFTTKPNRNNLNSKINPIVAKYKNPRPILGKDGAGKFKGNPLEKSKPMKKENFV